MYNEHPYFSLKNLGKKCMLHMTKYHSSNTQVQGFSLGAIERHVNKWEWGWVRGVGKKGKGKGLCVSQLGLRIRPGSAQAEALTERWLLLLYNAG